MITEKRFVSSHHAFWHELLPMGEHYIRTVNLELARFCNPLESASTPRFHGIVNELAFRIFTRAATLGVSVDSLDAAAVSEELSRSTAFIRSFRQHGRGPLPTPVETEVHDATVLAKRTLEFFKLASAAPLVTRPPFRGCGWLSECEGDVLASPVLYEIKAGQRAFRMQDVKQVLVYCALNFASKSYDIGNVCLFNPRQGIYFSESLKNVCELIAGRSAMEVLSEIIEYVSESGNEEGSA